MQIMFTFGFLKQHYLHGKSFSLSFCLPLAADQFQPDLVDRNFKVNHNSYYIEEHWLLGRRRIQGNIAYKDNRTCSCQEWAVEPVCGCPLASLSCAVRIFVGKRHWERVCRLVGNWVS